MHRDDEIKVTVAPAAVEAYRTRIDLSVDERGARIAVARDVRDYAAHRRPKLDHPPKRDPEGAEIWRAGSYKVPYHVHVHAAGLVVTRVGSPHAHWTPITPEKAAKRPGARTQLRLGSLLRQQRERTEMLPAVLAELAGVSVEEVLRMEAGEGVTDGVLRAVGDVLDVDICVFRRRR